MGIVGVGIDLVSIPDFAEQVDQPGTAFSETFTPGERRDASDKSSSAARHLAARVPTPATARYRPVRGGPAQRPARRIGTATACEDSMKQGGLRRIAPPAVNVGLPANPCSNGSVGGGFRKVNSILCLI